MPKHHILTVGISLLNNFARERNLPAGEAAKRHTAIAEFLHADPRKACAEINSLDSRTGFLSGEAADLAVTLAFTTTENGKLCASLIEKELKRRKAVVHRLPVRGVDAPARDFTPQFAALPARDLSSLGVPPMTLP
jgi:CRISPR/Cas system-associated protein Csm6